MTIRDKRSKGTALLWLFMRLYIPSLLLFSTYQVWLHTLTPPTVIYRSEINRLQQKREEEFVSRLHSNRRRPPGTPPSNKKSSSFVIFYNAFVNSNNFNQSLRIIKEQMGQIQSSTHYDTPIYYNLIGSNVSNPLICPNTTKCKRMRYLTQGEEVTTLQDLYQYCVDNPSANVVYLHDKGSFNPTGANHRIRKIATASAISTGCRNATKTNACNLCVNKFQFLPNHHTPGAMWTARCDYLSTLIPPQDFDAKRRAMFRLVRDNKTLQDRLYCVKALVDRFEDGKAFDGDQWKYMSIFRYATEHWALSGPDLKPCHTINVRIIKVNTKEFQPETAELGPGRVVLNYDRATTTGWYQLEGRKWEMMHLFGRLPPLDSFWWRAYRDAKVPEGKKIRC